MGQTAEPEEKKEDMEKAGSASQKEDAGTDAVMKADSEEEDFVDVDDYDDEYFEEEEDEGDEDEDDEDFEEEDDEYDPQYRRYASVYQLRRLLGLLPVK